MGNLIDITNAQAALSEGLERKLDDVRDHIKKEQQQGSQTYVIEKEDIRVPIIYSTESPVYQETTSVNHEELYDHAQETTGTYQKEEQTASSSSIIQERTDTAGPKDIARLVAKKQLQDKCGVPQAIPYSPTEQQTLNDYKLRPESTVWLQFFYDYPDLAA